MKRRGASLRLQVLRSELLSFPPPSERSQTPSTALRLLQPIALLQPTALLQAMPRLHAIPVAPTVDPPAKPTALPPRPPTPPALVRRPIASPRKPMPLKAPARGSGTLVPVRRNEAVCASLTSISIAVTATKRRARSHARSNARRSIRSRCLPEGSDARDIPAGLHLAGISFFRRSLSTPADPLADLRRFSRGDRDEDAARRAIPPAESDCRAADRSETSRR
jgi:hypothetical protein